MFRAYDASRERLVAVKLFKLDLPPEKVHALVAELQRIVDAALDHPALAAPLATGIVGVSAYLAQDYVAADSLDQAVREFGPTPAGDALRVAAQIAGALDCAGVAGITHGALHPRDVLLSSDETRLTGIGVARALERVGVVPPVRRPYTAPERVAGGSWDRRADVFSLASLAHELLWGRRPSGTGAEAAAALTEIAGGDLAALRAAFARARAENPAERFETALQFAEALSAAFPEITVVRNAYKPRKQLAEGRSGAGPATGDVRLMTEPEPRLPLEAGPDDTPTELAPVPPSIAAVAAAEDERFKDVEVAPALVDEIEEPPPAFVPAIDNLQSAVDPQSAIRDPQFESVFDRSRSAVWPLVLALGLGLAVGFAGGYGVGTHARPDTTAVAAVAPQGTRAAATAGNEPKPLAARAATPLPTAGAREFTENAVPAAPDLRARNTRPGSGEAGGSVEGAASSNSGRLLVRSTPAGARVVVDGKDEGRTPAIVRELARGMHQVRLVRDGYAPIERRVVITAAKPSQSVTIPLERAAAARALQSRPPAPADAGSFVGRLVVMSRPDGAKVFLDGKLAGTTPLSLTDVRAGEHGVRIERDGYRRWSSSVRVVAAEQNRVTASLER